MVNGQRDIGRYPNSLSLSPTLSSLILLTCEDEALLVGRNALLVLDLGLHVVDRVGGLDLERDGLAGERLDEDLHAAAQAEHQVQSGLLLDVVVRESATVLELLAFDEKGREGEMKEGRKKKGKRKERE